MSTTEMTDTEPVHETAELDAKTRLDLEAHIAHYARRLDQIEMRLDELDREWDVDRTLEAHVGILSLAGVTLGLFARRWSLLSAVALGFLVQQAFRGSGAPVKLLRRMGVRTAHEIDQERYALKALRGDFREIGPDSHEDAAVKAAKAMKAIGAVNN